MAKELQEYLGLDVGELLEHPEFRTLAMAGDVVIPAEYTELILARAVLLGLHDEAIALPTAAEKEADFILLMERSQGTKRPVVRRLWPRLAGVAATLLLLLTAGIWWLQPAAAVVYATGNGELQEIILQDGTSVTLNSNTTLRLPAGGWSAKERTVDLAGEAFFDVTRQKEQGEPRPFLVRTQGTEVRVLGTRFNVKERRGFTWVFLEEGAVRVNWTGTDNPETSLLPGEKVQYHQAVNQLKVISVNQAAEELAWTGGNLVFNRLSLLEALAEISDLYGARFAFEDDALGKLEVSSAGIPVDDLPLAIKLLEKALGLKIELEKDNVYRVSGRATSVD